jgi:putative membrane protein
MDRFLPKTVAESHAETTRMARRLFTAPRPRRMVLPILAFAIMEAYLLVYPAVDWTRVAVGSLAMVLPAYAAALLTKPAALALGGRMYFRRSFLLSFVGLIFLGAFQVVAVALFTVLAVLGNTAYDTTVTLKVTILAYGGILWVREVILSATSHSQHLRSLPAASLHPLLGLIGLALWAPFSLGTFLLSLLVLVIFFLSAVAYSEIAKRPLLRSFGADGFKLLRSTLDVYGEMEDEGVAELEEFFSSIGVAARIRVAGFAYRTAKGIKALFVAPTVHPGPMGVVGGSDLPSKVASGLADLTPNVLVAHGPTTHDENPATTAEVRKVSDTVRTLIAASSYGTQAGRACRAAFGRATTLAQSFGDTVLLTASFAPNPTDDIDSATGHAAVQEAKLAGAQDAIFVDAHNCLEQGVGLTLFGSEASHEIIESAKAATQAALAAPKGALRAGYARRWNLCTPDQGIGARGIEALVLEVDGQRTAYVLFDGNNMVPGLRDALRDRISALVQESEALTTDNHSVNLTMDGFNAVGVVLDRETILSNAEAAVRDAVANLEPVEVAPFSGDVPDFRIFGPQTASRLTTSINATMAVLRPALYVTLSGAVAIAALALVLL